MDEGYDDVDFISEEGTPEEVLIQKDVAEIIQKLISTKNDPRHERVLRLRY
jgi:DNA-directed RNA polymerase sigma subunit (sigma70/sigma32)